MDKDRALFTPPATPEELAWQKVRPRIPGWRAESCDATEFEAKAWTIRKGDILGFTRRDGTIVDGLQITYSQELADLDTDIKSECKKLAPGKRLENGSDYGLGFEYRGMRHLPPATVKKFFALKALLDEMAEDLKLIERAESIYQQHLEWKKVEQARREKARAAKLLRDGVEWLNKECRSIPVEAAKLFKDMDERPWTISPNVMEHWIMPYIVGKALKDLHVMRRHLIEQGIDPKKELLLQPPKITVPPGWNEKLEKSIGRKLSKQELLARNPKLRRLQKQQEHADALEALRQLEARETGRQPAPEKLLTYRRKANSGTMTARAPMGGFSKKGKEQMIEYRPGDEITVNNENELPGWPHAIDGWELVDTTREAAQAALAAKEGK